jgi:signal transduction histidine kinase
MLDLLESLEEFIVITKKDGTINYCNSSFAAKFELSIGDNIKEILKNDDKEIFFRNLIYIVEKYGKYNNFMRFLIPSNKSLIFCWLHAFLYKGDVVFEIFDLTQVEKRDSNINNEAYAKLLKYMSEGVAHSIRNPIMSAGGMLNRLKQKLPEDSKEKLIPYIDVVEKSLYRIMSIIADIEIISNSLPATLKKLNINRLIENIIEKHKNRSNIEFKLDLEDNLELYADDMHITFVIEEILKNAFDAIGGNKGTIEIQAKKEGQSIIIIICDNGKGIDEDNIPLVMIPFYSTKPSNMGIGLSLTKFVVEGYKGSIALYSKLDEGTKVIIELPIEKRDRLRKAVLHDQAE